jgi:hypothetical protein
MKVTEIWPTHDWHHLALGSVVWIDGENVGYTCGCGQTELVLGIYSDDPIECDTCGKKLYCEIKIKVFEIEACSDDRE